MAHPTRRLVLAGTATLLAGAALPRRARAAAGPALRIGDQKGGIQSIMKAAGALDGLPYPMEFSQFPAANPVLEALNAGAVDLGYAGDAPTTFALAAGLQGRVIGAIRSSGHGTAIVVPKDSAITDAAGLKGHRVAANRGSIAQALVLALGEARGWSAGDVTQANLYPAEAKTALQAGAVDAWSSWGVYIAQARLADGARVVADASGGLLPNLTFLVAANAAIAARRDTLLDFGRRWAAARSWALAHVDAYAPVLAADVGITPAVARLSFETDLPQPVKVDDALVADAQRIADLFTRARVIRSRVDLPAGFDTSFNAALAG